MLCFLQVFKYGDFMAHVYEKHLKCSKCGMELEYPECCGKDMDSDGELLFCSSCNKERNLSSCCEEKMQVKKNLKNLKKEVFGFSSVIGTEK